jgi:hypothetical protein
MKSSLLRTFFEWALITSVLTSVGFFAWYYFASRSERAQRAQTIQNQGHLQYIRSVMAALQAECEIYARTNADMRRLLTSPAASPAPATTKPGGK